VDRTVKDLQLQVERREKANAQLEEDITRSRDKIEKLLKTIDELQASESEAGLTARRAERAVKDEQAKAMKLEKELQGLKALKGGTRRGSGFWSVSGSGTGVEENGIEIPKRKSSISRQPSMSKGFL